MFNKIFIEKGQEESIVTKNVLNKHPNIPIKYIDKIEDIWGRVKKPYLQKRTNLNLFIGKKKGQLVKEAPDAYGLGNEKHYFFVHAYNCIYECQYCYLQGYFNTPDIVLFTNHTDITKEMDQITEQSPTAWFHAGEYSDSLSLTHLTNELDHYFKFFAQNPKAKLELRTKSSNISELLKLEPLDNVYVSFTISSHSSGKVFDTKCPSVKARLKSIEKLANAGFMIGIHFDPLSYEENFESNYKEIVSELKMILPNKNLGYISLGTVRFTKEVYREVSENYKDTKMLAQNFTKSFDGKLRYSKPLRSWMMNTVKNFLIEASYDENKIYKCMEDE